jgi:dTDP-glucose 4,6-dehydratase
VAEKFLILGASSFYGSNFVDFVESRGGIAVRWGRDEFTWLAKGDYGLLDEHQHCYMVNFASRSLVAESWDFPAQWMATNAMATTGVFMTLSLRGCLKKFVHVSTPETYGSTEGWVPETYKDWNPSTPYAVSRAAGDMMLQAYRRAYGFPAVITRTANIYGPGQPKHRFIPLAFDTLRKGERLELHGGGHTVRSWIHVRDACSALYKVAREGSIGQTYHISTQQEHSVLQVTKKICRLVGKSESLIGSQPDRRGKDHAYLLKSDALRNMGWRDTYTLDRGLQEYASGT